MRFTEFRGVPNAAAPHDGPVTVSNSAVTLLSLVTGGALHAATEFVQVTVETAPVRLTLNGTTPTTTLGFYKDDGADFILSRSEADTAKLIRQGATDAVVQIAQFKS